MREKILLRKTCSVYANDLHFATVIFPFIAKEVKEGTTIKTIFEKNEKENIEKVMKNVGIELKTKDAIKKIDWNITNINKHGKRIGQNQSFFLMFLLTLGR